MDWRRMQRILVPLDGSGTAEWALPLAVRIARQAEATLELARSLTSLSRAFPDVTAAGYLDDWVDRQQERETEYLGKIAANLGEVGLTVETHAAVADPVHMLVGRAAEADLVVMTAHGWSGPERAWLGHVADGLVHHVRAPVIIVRAESSDRPDRLDADRPMDHILVATDGSTAAQAAEGHAAGLARLLGAKLTLFRAVPAPAGPSSPYIPHAAILDREAAAEREREALAYLDSRVHEIEGVEVDTRSRATYHVGRDILEVAAEAGADLVAVGTHRDSRLARIVLGSVADKVVRGAVVPVLVAHAEE